MKETRKKITGYLPSLDGLRALAILSVIAFHDQVRELGPVSDYWVHRFGYLGVDLFFAISGVLICSRLLEEERSTGSISLRGFYLRRFFRIFPAAWLFLASYLILSLCNQLPRDFGGILTAFLMVRNFWVAIAGDIPRTWYTIHFWSLSVEEHFYLILPALLVFTRKRRVRILGVLSFLAMTWIMVVEHYPALQAPNFQLRTDIRIDALLIPAMFATLLAEPRIRAKAVQWLRPWVVCLGFVVFSILITNSSSRFVAGTFIFVIAIGFPLFTISTMLHPGSVSCRILELPVLRFIGRISFSLYLWQQLFFPDQHTPASWPLSTLQIFPFNYFAAFACSIASYYFVERPLIRVGHRLAHPTTPGHADLDESKATQPANVHNPNEAETATESSQVGS
jgi:peptidoglycan/LPS O-acetylase OafA/YrhL